MSATQTQKLSKYDLEDKVRDIVSELGLSGAKAMGIVMAELKKRYSGQYDGKMASDVVKSFLTD